MRDLIDVRGASGAVYRFNRLRAGNPLSPMGGNYVYARQSGDAVELVLVGEAPNLAADAQARWDEAVREHAAESLFFRLNISEAVRRREQDDITQANPPLMTSEGEGA